jgi:hypothetical protein
MFTSSFGRSGALAKVGKALSLLAAVLMMLTGLIHIFRYVLFVARRVTQRNVLATTQATTGTCTCLERLNRPPTHLVWTQRTFALVRVVSFCVKPRTNVPGHASVRWVSRAGVVAKSWPELFVGVPPSQPVFHLLNLRAPHDKQRIESVVPQRARSKRRRTQP